MPAKSDLVPTNLKKNIVFLRAGLDPIADTDTFPNSFTRTENNFVDLLDPRITRHNNFDPEFFKDLAHCASFRSN